VKKTSNIIPSPPRDRQQLNDPMHIADDQTKVPNECWFVPSSLSHCNLQKRLLHRPSIHGSNVQPLESQIMRCNTAYNP
jgi:hypothetical protein